MKEPKTLQNDRPSSLHKCFHHHFGKETAIWKRLKPAPDVIYVQYKGQKFDL